MRAVADIATAQRVLSRSGGPPLFAIAGKRFPAGRGGQWHGSGGDGITYRTLPGNEHPRAAYFGRGTGHNDAAVYSERPEDWEANLDRLARRLDTARTLVPARVRSMCACAHSRRRLHVCAGAPVVYACARRCSRNAGAQARAHPPPAR